MSRTLIQEVVTLPREGFKNVNFIQFKFNANVNANDNKNARSAFQDSRFRITKFHFVILGGVSANEVNFFAFGLQENSKFKNITEHEDTKQFNDNANANDYL